MCLTDIEKPDFVHYADAEKVKFAYFIAERAHSRQFDKAGTPYIEHPVRVCEKMRGNDCKIAALLHDTIEDTFVTKELIDELFGVVIGLAVDLLTRKPGESYMEFINRMCVPDFSEKPPYVCQWMERSYEIARLVKIADLEDNMNLGRLSEVTEEDLNRVKKYEKARKRLLEVQPR